MSQLELFTSDSTVGATAEFIVHSFDTVPSQEFATHMLAPSKATPLGQAPTLNLRRKAPSLARNSVTTPPSLVTQMLAPL
jgi:hypothetical protein